MDKMDIEKDKRDRSHKKDRRKSESQHKEQRTKDEK